MVKDNRKIKIVDGFKIRNTIDIDFGVIGEHKFSPFVPKDELWIDKRYAPNKKTLIELLDFSVKKEKLIKKYGYEKAKAVLRAQEKSKSADEKSLRLKLLKENKDAKIYLIDGRLVEQLFDPSFCFGGHGYVYDYIPKDEVWIDDRPLEAERKYIIIHELYERELMRNGKNYNNAHDFANAVEKEARRDDGVANYLTD